MKYQINLSSDEGSELWGRFVDQFSPPSSISRKQALEKFNGRIEFRYKHNKLMGRFLVFDTEKDMIMFKLKYL